MSLMDRRRALIGAGKVAPGVPLDTLTPGTGVKLAESGTLKQWIYLGLDIDGNARLLRDRLYGNARRMASSNTLLNYDGTELDNWLTSTFRDFLPLTIQSALVPTSRKYAYNNGANTNTIMRAISVLTVSELGNSGAGGATNFLDALKTYYGVTTNSAKVGKTESGTNKPYWLMDNQGSNYYRVFYTDGTLNGWPASNATAVWVRPTLSVNPAILVQITDDGYVIK